MKGLFFGLCRELLESGIAQEVNSYEDNNNIYVHTGLELEDIDFYYDLARKVPGKVLEVGCGYGRVLIELLKRGVQIEGVDISQTLLEFAKICGRRENVTPILYQMDMRKLNLPIETYDLIILPNFVMCYIKSYDEAKEILQGLKRILKPGGIIAFNFDTKDEQEISYGPALSNYDIEKDLKEAYTSIVQTEVYNEDLRLTNLATYVTKNEGTNIYVSSSLEFRWNFKKLVEIVKEIGLHIKNTYNDFEYTEFDVNADDECVILLSK